MGTDVMRLDPQVEATVEHIVNRALEKQRVELMSSQAGVEVAIQTSEKLAQTGIFGTNHKGVVFLLYMLARDLGVPVTKVQDLYHVWEQGGRIMKQRRAESMLADYHAAGGTFRLLENTPERVVGAFRAPNMKEPLILAADTETIRRAGLAQKDIHAKYAADMKVWYIVRRGIRFTMPECLRNDPLTEDEVLSVGTNMEIPANWRNVQPERPTPGDKDNPPADPPPALDVATEVKRAYNAAKRGWSPDGKPTKEDMAPAWAWLSIRVGAPIAGPGDITADTLDLAREVLALGKEEVLLRLSDHKAQQDAASADVVDAEFEEAPDNDDPFDGVA